MKRFSTAASLLLACAASIFAASPANVTYKVKTPAFDAIECSNAVKVIYTRAQNTSVTVTAPQDKKENVVVKVSGKTLIIEPKNKIGKEQSLEKVTVAVLAPSVTEFEASTAASIKVNAPLTAPEAKIEIETSTAGTVTIPALTCKSADMEASTAGSIVVHNLKCSSVDAEASTAGSIKIDGSAAKAILEASTAGSIDASGFSANNMSRSASTGGSIK
ncbi:MAG: DUF4097 family beta strand repeat protein [Muribaculaceae bacterium]|jgi:hypothetical protein|nr:DUF4097 family beta strand repeat protein [Muribaculaceae bacterium]